MLYLVLQLLGCDEWQEIMFVHNQMFLTPIAFEQSKYSGLKPGHVAISRNEDAQSLF